MNQITGLRALLPLGVFALLAMALPASASTISWTEWTPSSTNTDHTAGSASGTISGLPVNVGYSGEVEGVTTAPSWTPTSTFSGGNVGNAPVEPTNAGIQLYGGYGATDTITFSAPVVDPVMTIFSLGQLGNTAQFLFTAAEPFTIEGGGPSSQYSGSAIFSGGSCPAYAVCGAEGNGVIQFDGTFSALSWTNPVREVWYAFTVGAVGLGDVITPPTQVPAPSTLLLLGTGIAGLSMAARRRIAR